MKRVRIVGLGAAAAAAAAFFLHPRKGAGRRNAVRRGSERLMRRGAAETTLMGTTGRRGRQAATELRLQVEDALVEALGVAGAYLHVSAGKGSVTVRGEVTSLDQISRVSDVLDRFQGRADVVNLVRLREPAGHSSESSAPAL